MAVTFATWHAPTLPVGVSVVAAAAAAVGDFLVVFVVVAVGAFVVVAAAAGVAAALVVYGRNPGYDVTFRGGGGKDRPNVGGVYITGGKERCSVSRKGCVVNESND